MSYTILGNLDSSRESFCYLQFPVPSRGAASASASSRASFHFSRSSTGKACGKRMVGTDPSKTGVANVATTGSCVGKPDYLYASTCAMACAAATFVISKSMRRPPPCAVCEVAAGS